MKEPSEKPPLDLEPLIKDLERKGLQFSQVIEGFGEVILEGDKFRDQIPEVNRQKIYQLLSLAAIKVDEIEQKRCGDCEK